MKKLFHIFLLIAFFSCSEQNKEIETPSKKQQTTENHILKSTSLIILGTIQDAGSPQIGCKKECCIDLFKNPDHNRKVVSLGLIDSEENKSYLFEATPDIVTQSKNLKKLSNSKNELPDGIFITHAHVGHYTGLMHLGKEAINADTVPIFVMPKMKVFLQENGPWNQLVDDKNILLKGINDAFQIKLTPNITVSPFLAPHRDEYSETVGYKITGSNKSALFIPDIDKWEKWDKNIIEEIAKADYAFIDGTFYDNNELENRDMAEIPHPFIIESMKKFEKLPLSEKNKIYFIHFNHTNPVINPDSKEAKTVIQNGYNIAQINQIIEL